MEKIARHVGHLPRIGVLCRVSRRDFPFVKSFHAQQSPRPVEPMSLFQEVKWPERVFTQLHLVQKLVRKDLFALPRMSPQQVHRKCIVPFAVSAPSESDRSSSTVRFLLFLLQIRQNCCTNICEAKSTGKSQAFGYFSSTDVEWHLSRMLKVRDVRLISKRTEAWHTQFRGRKM